MTIKILYVVKDANYLNKCRSPCQLLYIKKSYNFHEKKYKLFVGHCLKKILDGKKNIYIKIESMQH